MTQKSRDNLQKAVALLLGVFALIAMAGATVGKPWVVGIVQDETRCMQQKVDYVYILLRTQASEEELKKADAEFRRLNGMGK